MHDLSDADLDRLFHALADATRRDILRRTATSQVSISHLAADYPMSFAAVQKHVKVLQDVGLISKERHGRELRVRAEAAAVERARAALDELADLWRGRVQRMSALLDDNTDQGA